MLLAQRHLPSSYVRLGGPMLFDCFACYHCFSNLVYFDISVLLRAVGEFVDIS